MARKMCVVPERTPKIASKRACLVGVIAAVVGALVACGSDDGRSAGSVGDADAGGAGDPADVANGNEGSANVGPSTGDVDARPGGDGAAGDGSTAVDTGVGDGPHGADGGPDGASVEDAAVDAGTDANGGTIVIRVDPRNDCSVTTMPPSPIHIPAGQWFHATFINVGEISTDIAKRDPFNVVPLVLGLDPGMTYADTIRPWCQGFSGKFWFEITPCENSPYDLEVDCGP
jgi:hypothetical protein